MANNMLEAALDYASDGWPVFPCSVEKTPLNEGGVANATTNPEKIEEWWKRWPKANIGCDVGAAGFMVLDFDWYHGAKLDECEAAVGKLPDTKLKQRSPRGGEHWFYTLKPEEIISPSASKLSPGVDVRSFHSYVLLAPSHTKDGEYEWIDEGKPAFRTDDMVRVANSYRRKDKNRDVWLIEPDLQENVADAIDWLKTKAKIAIEGQGGDHCAYATAAMMKSFGISEDMAFELIWEHWNPRCRPPWSADEADHLEQKVHNGYSYNTSPPGNVTKAYRIASSKELFKPVQADIPSGKQFTAGRFRFIDREGMVHIPEPKWIIPDLLMQEAYAIMYGTHGTGKTFIALDMALSICTGGFTRYRGLWAPERPGKVLMAVGEGRAMLRARAEAWEEEYFHGKHVRNFVLADPVPLVTEATEWFIDGALCIEPDGYDLCIIDTLGRAMQGANENDQQDASRFTMMVQALQQGLGCTVLALHHTNKDGTARGSSVFPADADTVLRLDRDPKAIAARLHMDKQKDYKEWEQDRFIALKDVKNSKVAVPADPQDIPKQKQTKNDREFIPDTLKHVLDTVVMECLEKVNGGYISNKDLAEMVAMDRRINVASGTLGKRYLVALREDNETKASNRYDPMLKKWRQGKEI